MRQFRSSDERNFDYNKFYWNDFHLWNAYCGIMHSFRFFALGTLPLRISSPPKWFTFTWIMEIFHILYSICQQCKSACGNVCSLNGIFPALLLFSVTFSAFYPYKLWEFNYFEWRKWNFIAVSTKYNQNKMQSNHHHRQDNPILKMQRRTQTFAHFCLPNTNPWLYFAIAICCIFAFNIWENFMENSINTSTKIGSISLSK